MHQMHLLWTILYKMKIKFFQMWQVNLLKKTVVKTLSYVYFLFCYLEYHIYIYIYCPLCWSLKRSTEGTIYIHKRWYKNYKFKILSLFIKIVCTHFYLHRSPATRLLASNREILLEISNFQKYWLSFWS